jgi:hypothetical protein
MAETMIASLKVLRLQVESVIEQLKWAWKGHMDHDKRLLLLSRYELFQHTIDVHLAGSIRILEIIKRNQVEARGDTGKYVVSVEAVN